MAYNTSAGAAENGAPSNTEANNHAAEMNQTLVTQQSQFIYPGVSILANNITGNGQHLNLTSAPPGNADHSQPFTMPVGKTAVGRVIFPVQPQGTGADLQVTLCPDLSGSPNLNAPISSTVIPASWINNITVQGSLTTSVPPLVTTQYNAVSLQNNFSFTWSQPAIGPGGAAQFATPTVSDSFMILSGGFTGSAAAATVATVQSLGGGFIGNPLLQPSLPQAVYYHMMTATESTVVVAGGTNGVSFYSNTWSANWDPNTGTIGAWTAQASLPVPVVQGCMASWGDFVYVTGGNADLTPASAYTNVYYANAASGQIQSWKTANPMPVGLQVHFAAAINGWLVVCGGQNSAGATQNKTYFAKINADGSLSSWYTGPNMPVGVYALGAQWSFSFTENAMVIFSGLTTPSTYTSQCQTLPVMTNSIGQWWSQDTGTAGAYQVAAFPHGEPGNWQLNVLTNTNYFAADTLVVPMISVPLPATGLTPGNVYHVVIHNRNQTLSNYVQLYVGPSTNFSTYLIRTPYTNGTWTPQANGFTVPMTIYDNSAGGGYPIHLWQSPNGTTTNLNNQAMSASTFVYDFYGDLLGYCEAIAQPQDPLNLNTLTTASVASWTPHGGTLTTTTAQTHNGYSNSGLLTPDGVSATSNVESEKISVVAGSSYSPTAWLYATTGITSNVSVSVNWFNSANAYISTSSNVQSLGAATWTLFNNSFVAPATAAFATLVPTLSGTPSAGNPLYISFAALLVTDPTTLSSVAQITYAGTPPVGPTGVTQLN